MEKANHGTSGRAAEVPGATENEGVFCWTIVWLEEWVWLLVTDRMDELVDCEAIPGRECDAEILRQRLLETGWREGRQNLRWVLLLESEPRGSEPKTGEVLYVVESGEVLGLTVPQWLRRCWDRWPARDWPIRLDWGPALLEGLLREREQQGRPVDAVYCPLGERVLVVGGGEAKGFRRMGRRETGCGRAAGVPGEDWLRQTAYLFSHYTGRPLGSLWCPEAPPEEDGMLADIRVEAGDSAEGEPAPQSFVLEVPWAVRELSKAGRCAHAEVAGVLTERLAQARSRWSFLAVGVVVLCLSGLLLLTGACRGPESSATRAGPALVGLGEEDRAAYRRLISREEAIRMRRQLERRPFELVGSFAGTVPGNVELRRIQVRRPELRKQGGGWHMRVEGRMDGDSPTPRFRSWVEHLEESGAVEQMDSLRMEPGDGEAMRFTLTGKNLRRKE